MKIDEIIREGKNAEEDNKETHTQQNEDDPETNEDENQEG